MIGELHVNMVEQEHPVSGSSSFLLKRWKRFSIYSKIENYNRTVLPSENIYQSSSVYFYNYIVVNKEYYSSLVYTSSIIDTTPSFDSDWVESSRGWHHREGTFRNTPNLKVNNYILTYDPILSVGLGRPIYGSPYIYTDNGEYFEIVKGYPRNHLIHKRDIFSLSNIRSSIIKNGKTYQEMYVKNRQTNTSTVNTDGIEDGSSPIQSIQVGNITLYRSDNVIN